MQRTQARITIAARWVTLVCSQMLLSAQPLILNSPFLLFSISHSFYFKSPIPSILNLPSLFFLRSWCSVSTACGLCIRRCQSSFKHSDISFPRRHGKLCVASGPPNHNAIPPEDTRKISSNYLYTSFCSSKRHH